MGEIETEARRALSSDRIAVAVHDPATSYRRGLGATLEAAGFNVVEPDDLENWASSTGHDALLFTVRSAGDWEAVRRLGALNREAKLVALLVDSTPDRQAEALRSGADSVVAWDTEPERIVQTLRAALEGCALLPTTVARAMACSGPALYDPEWITPEEIEWLQLLAQGKTIQQVAQAVGYSERAFYRVLHSLYGRMRVSNRTEAIVQASRWGLL